MGLRYSQHILNVVTASGHNINSGREGSHGPAGYALQLGIRLVGERETQVSDLGSALIQACEAAGSTIPR